jgi:hypothetical protein
VRNPVNGWAHRSTKPVSLVVRQAWQYLFEAWEENREDFQFDPYDVDAIINRDGWSKTVVRKFIESNRPVLKAEPTLQSRVKPPQWKSTIRVADMLDLDVLYPPPRFDSEIPDAWLQPVVKGLRQNLEHALDLESEIGGYSLGKIAPISPGQPPYGDYFGRTSGLSGSVIAFTERFKRLVIFDVEVARRELAAWPTDDDTIFSRLRIWACGITELVPAETFRSIIGSLSNKCLWHRSHQRDLLLVLAKRWPDLPSSIRTEIERRLLDGPLRWENEAETDFEERKARSSLDRLTWLGNNGCEFSFGLRKEIDKLRQKLPGWKVEYASHAADSMEIRGGSVRTDTAHEPLLTEPLRSLLSKAVELSGRTENFLVEKDPFAGLSAKRPVRAFAALRYEAKRGEFPEWAWRTFLTTDARSNDRSRFSALIAERLSRYPDVAVATIIEPVSDWILRAVEKLATDFPESFDKLIAKVIAVLHSQQPISSFPIRHGSKGHDWEMEAAWAPVGKIGQALLKDPRLDRLKSGEGLPTAWRTYFEGLLSLDGNLRRYATVILAHNLNWLYDLDPLWTEGGLLPVLDSNSEDDQNAFWSGFFRGAVVPDQELYVRIKPSLLATARNRRLSRDNHGQVLGRIILAGWGSQNDETQSRFISNAEMHDVLLCGDDDFRCFILWQVERWSQGKDSDTAGIWSRLLSEFLRDVWPQQISVKTPKASACLCDLALSDLELFPKIADIVLPLLTEIDRNNRMHSSPKARDEIANLYPRQVLSLLDAVLPDDLAAWPFGVEVTLDRITEADNELKRDQRWLELNRKWQAR